MKIVHLCTETHGGAGLGTLKLSQEMSKHGIDSCILTKEQLSDIRIKTTLFKRVVYRIKSRLHLLEGINKSNISRKFIGTWTDGTGSKTIVNNPKIQEADIVYLHWINNMLSIEEVGNLLSLGKKVVWILRDMWPMTGGCHQSLDCNLYQTHCNKCPLVMFDNNENLSYKVFERKLKNFTNKSNLIICGISSWISECARQSRLFSNNNIFTIPNIMDAEVYHPIKKELAREVLQLPIDKKLLLFGAQGGTKNFYKGWCYLSNVLQNFDNSYELVVFGEDYDEEIVKQSNLKVHFLGRIFDHKVMMSLIYSSVDVYVSPTLAESFGKTIAESSLCCTPVVCFGIGGTLDLVKHQETGYLVKYKDSNDILRGIKWVIDNNSNGLIGKNAREYINSFCNSNLVINQHKEMWKQMK